MIALSAAASSECGGGSIAESGGASDLPDGSGGGGDGSGAAAVAVNFSESLRRALRARCGVCMRDIVGPRCACAVCPDVLLCAACVATDAKSLTVPAHDRSHGYRVHRCVRACVRTCVRAQRAGA